jgi:protein phosphatase
MSANVATAGHRGRRKYNQDTIVVREIGTPAGLIRLLAVLDGMGGMRAGDRASQLAAEIFVQTMTGRLAAATPDERRLRETLADAVRLAHEAVFAEGQDDSEKRGMGTTLVAIAERDGRFVAVNVGDSRAYLWSPADRRLQRLTRDHSVREEGVRFGKLTEEEAERSPYAHALTRAVGSGPTPQPDLYPEPDGWLSVPAAGAVLLCSDGLLGGLRDEQIEAIVAGSPDAAGLAEGLLRAAYHGGSTDNISVIVLTGEGFRPVGPAPDPAPPIDEAPPPPAADAAPPVETPPPAPFVATERPRPIWPTVGLMVIALLFLLYWIFRPPTFNRVPPPAPAGAGAPADAAIPFDVGPGPAAASPAPADAATPRAPAGR